MAEVVKNGAETVETAGQVKCGHFWEIEDPHGPVSVGTCKFCDERRQFRNFFEGSEATDWPISRSRRRQRGGKP